MIRNDYILTQIEYEYRPEQIRVYEYLKQFFDGCKVYMEYHPKDLVKFKDVPIKKGWSIDIAVISNQGNKLAIDLDGSIHDKDSHRLKDEDKRMTLAWNGWRIITFEYESMPRLWEGREGYEKEIIEEISKKRV